MHLLSRLLTWSAFLCMTTIAEHPENTRYPSSTSHVYEKKDLFVCTIGSCLCIG